MGAAKRARRDPEPGIGTLPCAICGQASSGWVYTTSTDDEGHDLLDAYSACDAHRLVQMRADSQAS
jgi:hypothetical protein